MSSGPLDAAGCSIHGSSSVDRKVPPAVTGGGAVCQTEAQERGTGKSLMTKQGGTPRSKQGPGDGYLLQALLKDAGRTSFDELTGIHRHWIDYALSTNERGQHMLDGVEAVRGSVNGLRWLDIGAGYGGLAIAAGRRGASVLAIEIDPRLGKFAAENIRDHPGLDIDLRVADALGGGAGIEPGVWDVVTLDNVIEHVHRPQQVFLRLTEFLSPQGIAYIAAPNGRSLRQVMADCHYQRFGISLLDPARGARYMAAVDSDVEYDVTWMHRRGIYASMAAMFGLDCRLVNGSSRTETIRANLLSQVDEVDAALNGAEGDLVPEEVADEVRYHVEELLDDCRAAIRLAESLNGRQQTDLYQELKREYLDEIWYLVIARPGQQTIRSSPRIAVAKAARKLKRLFGSLRHPGTRSE